MEQKSFMFYNNFLEAIEQLPEEERANACYRFCRYALNDELPEDKSLAMFCIGVRFSVHKYQGRGGNHNPNGKNQYTKSGQKWSKVVKSGQSGQSGQNRQTETETETETKRENIERKDQIFVKGGFIPPTLEEVLEYAKKMDEFGGVGGFKCSEKTAREFYDFYAGQGWVTSGNIPIRNWQVKLRGWANKPNRFKTKQEIDDEDLIPIDC